MSGDRWPVYLSQWWLGGRPFNHGYPQSQATSDVPLASQFLSSLNSSPWEKQNECLPPELPSCFAMKRLCGLNASWGPPRHIMHCRLEDKQRQISPCLSRRDFRSGKKIGSQKSRWGGATSLKSDDCPNVLEHIMRKRALHVAKGWMARGRGVEARNYKICIPGFHPVSYLSRFPLRRTPAIRALKIEFHISRDRVCKIWHLGMDGSSVMFRPITCPKHNENVKC